MTKNDVKAVILSAVAGVAAMMIYDKIKKMPNLALSRPVPVTGGPLIKKAPSEMGWIKEDQPKWMI